ncbi:methyltransferase RsmF C-terminal domain-like protein, partial [Barnesiella intestinihominis]
LHTGITVATLKGKDYVPHISLALSTAFDTNQVVHYEASLDTALAYLRRESLFLPTDLPRGYILVTYEGFPLGWAKHLGNRTNNLYPQEWRIRSGYTPDTPFELNIAPK